MEIIKISKRNIDYFRSMDPFYLLPRVSLGMGFALGVIETDDKGFDFPVGLIIGAETEDSLIIQWMFVEEEYRGMGYGSGMLQALTNVCVQAGKKYLKIYFADRFGTRHVCGNPDSYFISQGIMKRQDLAGECRLTIKEFIDESTTKATGIVGELTSFDRTKSGDIRGYLAACEKLPVFYSLFNWELSYFALNEKISFFAFDKNKRLVGGIFATYVENQIFIAGVAATSPDLLADLLVGLVEKAKEIYTEEAFLNFIFSSEKFFASAKVLIPELLLENHYLYEEVDLLAEGRSSYSFGISRMYQMMDSNWPDVKPFFSEVEKEDMMLRDIDDVNGGSYVGERIPLENMELNTIERLCHLCVNNKTGSGLKISPAKIDIDWFETHLSSAYFEDGAMVAAVLIAQTADCLVPVFYYYAGSKNYKELIKLLEEIIKRGKEIYSPEQMVEVMFYNKNVKHIFEIIME